MPSLIVAQDLTSALKTENAGKMFAGGKGTDGTGIAMSCFQLANLGPNAEAAIPALSEHRSVNVNGSM